MQTSRIHQHIHTTARVTHIEPRWRSVEPMVAPVMDATDSADRAWLAAGLYMTHSFAQYPGVGQAVAAVAAAQSALVAGESEEALGAADRAVKRMGRGGSGGDLAYALVLRSRAHSALGDQDAAEADARNAWSIASTLSGPARVERVRVQARERLDEVLVAGGSVVVQAA